MKIVSKYILPGLVYMLFIAVGVTGCKKFVDVPAPVNQVPAEDVFTNDATAANAVRGLYSRTMAGANVGLGGGIQASLGVSADELLVRLSTNQFNEFYINNIAAASNANLNQWNHFYSNIYNSNAVLKGIAESTGMTETGKKTGNAEARFLRAFNYFYLVNMYGDVPMSLTTNYEVNRLLDRAATTDIYQLIKDDLLYAWENLPAAYQGANRIRANKHAAGALLAKVYLYLQDWANAETQAANVIGNTADYTLETNLNNVFLWTSKEAILRLHHPTTAVYTLDGFVFVPTGTGAPNYQVTDTLYNTFETGDLRKANWIKTNTVSSVNYRFPFKYKQNSGTGATPLESHIFLRLAEIYLIRAEARAKQNNLSGAIADLDKVRQRAGIPLIAVTNPGITQTQLLDKIAHERWVELFAEHGDRWLDLKRMNIADAVLAKKPNWKPTCKLFPIPQNDILYNPNLTQNQGYN
jgi:hypothetical protein